VSDSSAPATRRAPMPVRLRIQSSLVSTRRLRSLLLRLVLGIALPQPTRARPRPGEMALPLVGAVMLSETPGGTGWNPQVGSVNHR